ncbi:MAG: 30S ribosomal protein S6 [Candidatus Omnitrophota bacterium]|mgnify:CR=1 FL=1
MNKYEAMFIIRPDLSEDEKKTLFSQIGETVTKNQGQVSSGAIWSEKRKLYFPIKKHQEGVYYLLQFSLPPLLLKEVTRTYSLNENILRSLFTKLE